MLYRFIYFLHSQRPGETRKRARKHARALTSANTHNTHGMHGTVQAVTLLAGHREWRTPTMSQLTLRDHERALPGSPRRQMRGTTNEELPRCRSLRCGTMKGHSLAHRAGHREWELPRCRSLRCGTMRGHSLAHRPRHAGFALAVASAQGRCPRTGKATQQSRRRRRTPKGNDDD